MLAFLSNGITSTIIDKGSIVWMPLPRFDSPSVFSRLLDDNYGGEFSILPIEDDWEVKISYISSNVLKTEFSKNGKRSVIIDVMPLGEAGIIRHISSDDKLRLKLDPVFDYGLRRGIIEEKKEGIKINDPGKTDCIALFSNLKLNRTSPDTWIVDKGKGFIYMVYSADTKFGPFHKPFRRSVNKSFKLSVKFWKQTVIKKKNRISDPTLRQLYDTSLTVLLASIYQPTGAPIAAPTTSLPEVIGGKRNWDYRFAWIRDSSIISEGLLYADYIVEARRILGFLLGLINFTSKPFLHPLYTVDGGNPPPEREITWLNGFKGSRPVRIGNAAAEQVQLDVEGIFINAIYEYFRRTKDKKFINSHWEKLEHIADWESKNWRMRDSGIWEERGVKRHYTHSKVMMWVALDKIGKMAIEIGKEDRWSDAKEQIKSWIMENCVNSGFTRYAGTDEVDASLLTLPLYGFVKAKDETFLQTLKKIENDLYVSGYVKRYRTDFMGEAMHPFTLASAWLARTYIRLGKIEKAELLLKNLYISPLGLIGEHVNIERKEFTGNFPQMFTHAQVLVALEEMMSSAHTD
ncbi:glycoside hydrolase [Candidatus Acidianus copahuensis]|uniref:Glycoside hydrolase n=1 Tax=Candidatus Acidianus copahuensis TaxID=1160895 RepID=A0A031LUG9_9CREN|nr:alpha,alpha-trehalase TreH1 [Candidatus Acidianus copahuensis]EZQ11094.1 glycoside hydrolase [Candidatus Acidianus copahuensis]